MKLMKEAFFGLCILVSLLLVCFAFLDAMTLTNSSWIFSNRKSDAVSLDRASSVLLDGKLAWREWVQYKEPLFELYAYSAFYDKRNASNPSVKVIGVSELLEEAYVDLLCILHYNTTNFTLSNHTVQAQSIVMGPGSFVAGRWLKEYIFVCPVDGFAEIPTNVPSFVSLVTTKRSAEKIFYLEVEIPKEAERKESFGVCVAASYGHADPVRIVEWVELNRIFGVNKIIIYNNSLHYDTSKVFMHYVKNGLIEFHQTPPFMGQRKRMQDIELIALHWAPAINDCLYRYMYTFWKILVIDFDEFIVPQLHMNYTAMVNHIEKVQGFSPFYIFRNAYFFLELPQQIRESPQLVTLRHQTHLPPSPADSAVKSLINPRECISMHHHVCWKRANESQRSIGVSIKLALNQHYKPCHFASAECKRWRNSSALQENSVMLKFREVLLENVSRVLQALREGINASM